MDVTIDIRTLFLIVIGIALLILIVYLIILTRKCIVTVDRTNSILEDAEAVTELAAKRSKDIDGIIDGISESVSTVSKAVKGEQNTFAAAASVIKAIASLKTLFSNEDKTTK